jgi:hypothetical protein
MVNGAPRHAVIRTHRNRCACAASTVEPGRFGSGRMVGEPLQDHVTMTRPRCAPAAKVVAADRFNGSAELWIIKPADEPLAVTLDDLVACRGVRRVLERERVAQQGRPPDVDETALGGPLAVHDLRCSNRFCHSGPIPVSGGVAIPYLDVPGSPDVGTSSGRTSRKWFRTHASGHR